MLIFYRTILKEGVDASFPFIRFVIDVWNRLKQEDLRNLSLHPVENGQISVLNHVVVTRIKRTYVDVLSYKFQRRS